MTHTVLRTAGRLIARLGEDRFVTMSIALEPGEASLGEVLVETEQGAAVREAGMQTIRASNLDRVPTPDIGGDLASNLQTLPGVVSLGDRGGRLYVRGGTPAQNLVLVDGQLIYQPFHIVGSSRSSSRFAVSQ